VINFELRTLTANKKRIHLEGGWAGRIANPDEQEKDHHQPLLGNEPHISVNIQLLNWLKKKWKSKAVFSKIISSLFCIRHWP
jgi:hypothetical protein